ncbi:MAG: alginate export family protein [Gemmatimonadetes bacterium]|nr:alginate export family protein [Gemmatimonadota bacterium]
MAERARVRRGDRRVALSCAVVACVLGVARAASAQPTPARAPLKDIPLAGARPVTLTLAGQARWREEFFRAFNTLPLDDDHAQSRVLLSGDFVVGRRARGYARAFGEWRDAQSYGRTLPGGARPQDADRSDWQNAYLEVGRQAAFVRVGRQEIALNRERLIGVPDWSNTRRGSQGARAQLVRGAFSVELVDARPMVVRQAAPNRADSTQRFRTMSVGSAPGARPLARGLPALWQAYHYAQRIVPTTGAATSRTTSGGRLQWTWAPVSAGALRRVPGGVTPSVEVEGAVQRGHTGDDAARRALQAAFWVVETQWQWKRAHGAPSLALGVEEATGDNARTTARLEQFAVLYPAAHAHGGFADVIGRPNVREWHAIATWMPHRALDLRGAAYRFDRRRLDDGVYTKANAIFRATPTAPGAMQPRHVADEIDLTGTWRYGAHLRVIAGGALVVPGAFLTATATTSRTERWGFVGTTLAF